MKSCYKLRNNSNSKIIYNVLKHIRRQHDLPSNCGDSTPKEITLSNGMNIPILGLGTWGVSKL